MLNSVESRLAAFGVFIGAIAGGMLGALARVWGAEWYVQSLLVISGAALGLVAFCSRRRAAYWLRRIINEFIESL